MIHIRNARHEDAPTIVRFQKAMALETEGLRLDDAAIVPGVRAIFDDPAKGTYLIAEVGGDLVASLLTIPEWSDWRNGTVLWIHSLYVEPAWRRRRVYRAMYEHLRKRVCADPTLKGLRLYVEKNNARATKVYEALGMDGEHYRMFEWLK